MSEEEILESRMLNYPLTQYMFCSPDEGGAAVVVCRADIAHRYTSTARSTSRGIDPAHPALRIVRGVQRRGPPIERATSPDRDAVRRPPTRWPASGPSDVDVAQIQDTEAGAEVMHMAENGFCADGEQER